MTLGEKQTVMACFHAGEIDVLVATPVIEVGIDVPNATVMMIESAERFGLSQLHQLRGRVGRGEFSSHCLLMSDGAGTEARKRLSIVTRSSDGFELSEEDLQIRGPGDYVGTRQSGFVEFKVARLSDVELMMLAKTEATELLAGDPELEARSHSGLAALVKRSSERMTGTPS
jgi:ATP-dependent DNA helicase RecG